MPVSPLDLPLPLMRRYRRCPSLPIANPPRAAAFAGTVDHEKQVVRTRSCDLYEPCRLRIAYSDATLVANSIINMNRLIRAAQQPEEYKDNATAGANTTKTTSNGVLLAKKALRYRKLLARAQAVDMDDPAFDIREFLRIKWQKVEKNDTANGKYNM